MPDCSTRTSYPNSLKYKDKYIISKNEQVQTATVTNWRKHPPTPEIYFQITINKQTKKKKLIIKKLNKTNSKNNGKLTLR